MTASESSAPSYLDLADGTRIAYRAVGGRGPGVVFLGGFVSDMTGIKATHLDAWCRARGQAFVRFDYSGHGQSSGRFEDGTIGRWAAEAVEVIDRVTQGPQVLVGSSMGGWIMLLAALARPDRVAGLAGIAAGPDFTADMLASMSPEARAAIERDGVWRGTNDLTGEGVPITRALIDDGNQHLLLDAEIALDCPVRLVQGMADDDVAWETAIRIASRLRADDVVVHLVKDGDHRLWREQDLSRITGAIDELSRLAGFHST